MPDIDGLEVLSWFTTNAPDTPVIVVSGTGVIGDVVEALHLGAWDYIDKPIADMSVPLHAIEKSIERARLLQENKEYQILLEERIEKATFALRESEERFRRLAENAKDVIFRLTIPDGNFEFVSAAAYDMFGYSPEEFYKTPKKIWKIIHPQWSMFFKKNWKKILNGDIQPIFEYLIVHKTGIKKWMYQRNVLIKDEDSNPVAIEGFITDITERKELESQLRQSQKMEAIGTLAGGIAHDFNNILAVIMGNASLMQILIPEDDSKQDKINNIITASERASDLIMQILSFSRKNDQAHKSIQISLIVKESLKLLKAALPSTIEIKQNILNTSFRVTADPTHLHQIIMNLCTNAKHAMRETGGILEVALDEIPSDGFDINRHTKNKVVSLCKLTVSDTGEGMDQKIVDRIFDPYFTTKKKDVGTGLGLSVVLGIVKNLGGKIDVISKPGHGSKFNIYLPNFKKETGKKMEKKDKVQTGQNELILFVDDEDLIVEIGKATLEQLGYEVFATTMPEEALKEFKSHAEDFRLVITDMTMPHMTGQVLAKEIMKIRPDLPIILCTGYNDNIDETMAKESGIRKYIMKPFTITKITNAIREILDQQENLKDD